MTEPQKKQYEGDVVDWRIDEKIIRFYAPNPLLRQFAEAAAEVEPETLAWLRTGRPGETLFDVGASNGIFTVFAAAVPQLKVFAFEAEAQNYAILEMNLHLNSTQLHTRPHAFCVAIGEQSGIQDIYCARYGAGYHMKILGKPVKVGETKPFEPDHVQSVLTISLDDSLTVFGLPVPNLLKIDVDGAEEWVIKGGTALLRRPELRSAMIELVEPKGRSAKLVGQLQDAGLRFVEAHPVRHLKGGYYNGLFNCVFERANG